MYTADHLMCRSILDMGTAQLETEMLLTFVNDWWVERCKVSYINGYSSYCSLLLGQVRNRNDIVDLVDQSSSKKELQFSEIRSSHLSGNNIFLIHVMQVLELSWFC
jgi:hypothetical protein